MLSPPENIDSQRLLSLATEVARALTWCDSVDQMLQKCALALVTQLQGDLARLWLCNEQAELLELCAEASSESGINLHTKSIRETVPQSRAATIAASRTPYLTNALQAEALDSEQEFVASRQLVAFAGYPLQVGDQMVGVLELFSSHTFSQDVLKALGSVCDGIAVGVHRKQMESQLREQERLFRLIVDNMQDVFWLTSPGGIEHHYISPAFERIFGTPVQRLRDNPFSFIESILPEDRPILLRLMSHGANPPPFSDIEYRIRRPDGEIRWLWTRAFALYNENGALYQVCGVTHDITAKKEAERRVSEFYSMVSHELRTPLTSIRAALGLIEGGMTGPVSPDTVDLISIACGESERLIRLINDILDMRKMEAGKLPLQMVPLDADEVLSRTLSVMRGFAFEHNVTLSSSVDCQQKFMGDHDRVVQVLTNLLSNAIKFSPSNEEVFVTVETAGNGRIRFSVIDKGPGIPKQQVHKLFGIFQQLDSSDSRARGGTGLGLAISKAIVERLGGSIGFTSAPEQGSIFWFELLPVVGADEQTSGDNNEDSAPPDMLSVYKKSLPIWLDSIGTKLELAREQQSTTLLRECLNVLQKIRLSAEPCGLQEVVSCMIEIEENLLQLMQGKGSQEECWNAVNQSMKAALNCSLLTGNNK